MFLLHFHRPKMIATLLVSSVYLSGCAHHKTTLETVDEQFNLPDSYSFAGEDLTQNQWWLAFQDQHLNSLIEHALVDNFNLRSSFAKVKQSRALKTQANSRRGLIIGADLVAQEPDDNTQYRAGLSASYEVDLWGELRAGYAEADFDYVASQQDYRAAAITLSAEVAITWYELLAAENSLAVYQQQLATNESILVLAQEQFINGLTTISDSTQQAAEVESSKAALANQQATVETLKHSLNVLLGNNAKEPITIATTGLGTLPPLPLTGIPSRILAQRPDVYSQWLEIQSTQQEVAEAIAQRYPSLSIGVDTGSIAASASDLFATWTTMLLANVAVDIWTGGNNSAVVAQRRASVEEATNDYRQLLLEAIQETEDALSNERYVAQRLHYLEQQRALTYQALEQLRTYYINGGTTFTAVLTSLNSAQNLDISVIDVKQSLIANRIALYRTLASGWDIPELNN